MPKTGGKNVVHNVEVFRVGSFRPITESPISYSASDLERLVENYDATNAPTPIVIRHPKTDDLAFGWVQSFRFDGNKLTADIGEIDPDFSERFPKGAIKKCPCPSFFRTLRPIRSRVSGTRAISVFWALFLRLARASSLFPSREQKRDTVTVEFSVEDIASGFIRSVAFADDREGWGSALASAPPYSPDFNPIEMAFAKIKAFLRNVAARTIPKLHYAIALIIDLFSPDECQNFFMAAGYDPNLQINALTKKYESFFVRHALQKIRE